MLDLALTHWPFIAVSLLLGVFGAVVKPLVLPPDKLVRGWRLAYQVSLPLHAACAGALLGAIPAMPLVGDFAPKALYYAFAGLASSYVYDAARHFIAQKQRMSMSPATPRGETVEDGQP